jgi:uncharacterized protein with PQ loop repeat
MIDTIILIVAILLLQGSSVPQFIKNYKRKTTNDISIIFPLMIVLGYILTLIIAFRTDNIYFQILYIIGIINFSLLIAQILYYRRNKKN